MKKIFWNGIKALLPIAVSIAIVAWLFNGIESFFGFFLKKIIPHWYFQGMGVILCLIIIFAVGTALKNWIARKFHEWVQRLFRKIPIIKTLYNGMIDLMAFFDKSDKEKQMGYVVRVQLSDMTLLGLVTREEFDDFPKDAVPDKLVAVYLPMSYNIGGYTVFLPHSTLTPIDMKGQEAMMFCLTAGLKRVTPKGEPRESQAS